MSAQPLSGALRRTPLYETHLRLGARLVPFAGWEMPVQYKGVIEEHQAVRHGAGMFDVSHMGRFEVRGVEASHFLRYLCTWDMARLKAGEGHYAAMCREDGGILDDVYVFALVPSPSPEARYLVVVNAANAEKIRGWMTNRIVGFQARLVDRHATTAMIAVQGPQAVQRAAQVVGAASLAEMRPRGCGEIEWRNGFLFASRTGYTGEDGVELVMEAGAAPTLWQALLDAGVTPCGLGARDTLRLEAALLLYGNDIDEETNPWEVGLEWAVALESGDFIGRDALLRLREAGLSRRLVCLKALERGIMRAGCPILLSGRQVGKVTSGGYSPALAVSIGMGFVPPHLAAEGTKLIVDVRGKPLPVQIVPRPFYRRPR